jgi:hypothetical protein
LFFNDKNGFIDNFITFFLKVFNGTYFNTKEPKRMLYEATDDLKSFIQIIVDILWNYFETLKLQILTSYSQLFYNIVSNFVHSKSYSILFPLYEKTYSEKDILSNQSKSKLMLEIKSLQNCIPKRFGINKKFSSLDDENNSYSKSIKLLESIQYDKTSSKKREKLSLLRESIMMEMREFRMEYNKNHSLENNTIYSEEELKEDSEWQPGAEDIMVFYCF